MMYQSFRKSVKYSAHIYAFKEKSKNYIYSVENFLSEK